LIDAKKIKIKTRSLFIKNKFGYFYPDKIDK
jgi:hypothetical protein